ncbi:MAG TPA: hypothetical protein VFA43_23970 [Gemmatimonadaceae bacterium]|nr:hypothetical protein [Gemmatimonadaceae bacterium]
MDARTRVERRAAWVSGLRLVAGLAAIGCFVLALTQSGTGGPIALAGSLVAVVVFAGLVTYHDRLKSRIADLVARAQLTEWAAHRVDRNWSRLPPLPPDASAAMPPDHPYASDLDLFGSVSIARLLPPMTALGFRTVRGWLLALPPRPVTAARQEAVAELRERVELRETFAVQGARRIGRPSGGADAIAAWATNTSPPTIPTWSLVAAAALLVAATILSRTYWWPVPLVIGRVLTSKVATGIDETIKSLMNGAESLSAWMGIARSIGEETFQSTLLRGLQDDLGHGEDAAWRQIQRLRRVAEWAAVRASPALHFVLNWGIFWDFWIAAIGLRWRGRNGPRVPSWMSAIGACESLAALATMARENPDWTFPALIEATPARLVARGIGHPVLPAATRVANDVSIGPEGTLLLVTGSNMAGKSTFLRAIGTNAVLARVGSTVCASAMEMSPFRLWTVVRIEDSLERGVSYFMAELERLKHVVEAARSGAADEGRLLYLFDEILQGTNSAERLIAARRVLRHLMAAGAVGVVTTHDLSLADADVFEDRVQHVHFREQVESTGAGGRMTFDYRARPGKATSTNALKLLELVGLSE